MQDIWTTRDLPVLTAYAELDADGADLMNAEDEIAASLGLSQEQMDASIGRLAEANFVRAAATFGGSFVESLTERGRRTAGSWPSAETAADRLLAALDAIAEDASRPESDRQKARKFGRWVGQSINTIGLEVAASVITGQLPGS